MKIKYLGHASFHIEIDGIHLIVDPFISANELAKDVNIDSLKADYILITHGHQDHVLDVEAIAKNNPDTTLVSNYEIIEWFGQKGLSGHPLNHGGKVSFDFGTVKYVNAVHSSVLPDGAYGGNPGGFIVTAGSKCIYIAGDTAVTMDMKLIPEMGHQLDLAIFPVGDNFTMGYEDAALASDFVKCDKVMGCHYDTFPPIEIDKVKAKAYFASKGKELLLLDIGDSILI
ncbi:metal-dependent hydrolase [Allomuricauda sp. SCSIO 65647]|uniref:metal-dependent hydrolase n=1 Tax=Allomuricauda sp. SCSIO 65647 TaxID=2908843 RepID=UPI001F369E0F|nr:metal-dependent hydrolase [Muricauda sp. SCSIO 65647]UJH66852.1 metal-dependent hydrolase [Muricauda sp. SCSIO 65647]